MKKETKPNCRACEHFFITWDPRKPNGCRAIGFKGKAMPNVTVHKTSGKDCLLFRKKRKKPESH